MLNRHKELTPRLNSCFGQVHRRPQSTTRRMVRPDSDGADQEGRRRQRHLPGEARDRCSAGRSQSIVEPKEHAITPCCCSFTTLARV